LGRDSLTAEFSARLLVKVGLEAEACSLASMTQWRDRGWARYIVWKARQPWEAPAQGMPVGRQPRAVRASEWVLAMGRPARGVWPVIRFTSGGASEEITICAEDWILLPRRIQAQGWITLVNDLRAPGEDRNAAIEPVDDFAEEWFTAPPPDVEGFRQRLGSRLRTWGDPPGSPVTAFVTAGTGLVPLAPCSTSLAVPGYGAWMLGGPGSITWRGVPDSGAVLVARGQPATGIWPIIEIGSAGGHARRVVDTWSWTPLSVVVSSGDSLLVRFVNDFWNPDTRQDRNLWIAGLFVDTSQARTHATH
jgi:hypothetical protein